VSLWEEEASPPLLTRSYREPLDGDSRHGPLQERWPTAGGVHDNGTRATSKGGRLRLPNRSATNSSLPKEMVLPRGKPSPGECSPLVMGTNTDDRTIRTA
jgi:hypothetical protein